MPPRRPEILTLELDRFKGGRSVLWDDIDQVTARAKISTELVAALVVAGSGLAISSVTVLGSTVELGLLAVPLTVFWILVVTNAFNLMDGLDGLAAGLATIAAVTCSVVLLARDEWAGALLLVSLVGAIAGFFAYNFHPPKIFLGDCGSLLVGFLLAVTAIMGQQKDATTLAVAVPLLIFALPISLLPDSWSCPGLERLHSMPCRWWRSWAEGWSSFSCTVWLWRLYTSIVDGRSTCPGSSRPLRQPASP